MIAAAAVVVVPTHPAFGANGCPAPDATHFEVSNTSDALVAGSLRTALADATAANGGEICLQLGLGTITLGSTLSSGITGSFTILGNGNTVTGNDTFPLLRAAAATLTLDRITMTHGFSAILDVSGGVSVARITITDSTFTDNAATGLFGLGGAVAVISQTIGHATIDRSTFARNSSTLQGSALFVRDLGATITNSTFTDNVGLQGGITALGPVVIRFSTFVNTPLQLGAFPPPDLRIYGTTITGGTLILPNCFGGISGLTVVSEGWNFADDTSCQLVHPTDSQVAGNDPMLGPLADNGGPTQTRLPLVGSPLLDRMTPLVAGRCPDEVVVITTDQRSLPRPSGPGCEVGAVEVQVPVAPAVPASPISTSEALRFTG